MRTTSSTISLSLWAFFTTALVCIPPFDFVVAASESRVKQKQKQPEAYQQRLFEWILEDPDGFVHPSILIQRLGPVGNSGPDAMHITEDVPAGTPLIVLPRKYVIESHMKKTNESIAMDDDYRMCVTVKKMLDEYENQKHNDTETSFPSSYAPYLSYLFEDTVGGTTRGLLPGTWSDQSKGILYLILDHDHDYENESSTLRPHYFDFDSIFDVCVKNVEGAVDDEDEDGDSEEDDSNEGIFVNSQMAEDAYMFLLSRGWYDKLLPVVDMLNHRNGPNRNVEVTSIDDEEGNDVAAYAWRDMRKGEQLQYSYSECMDETCGFGKWRYSTSTQYIFGQYGFVELYPRRWIFDVYDGDTLHQLLNCEVTTDPSDDTKMVFQWIFTKPTELSIVWMEKQLARLKSIESLVKTELSELESKVGSDAIYNIEHEREQILEYYEVYIEVLELALEHQNDQVGFTIESWEAEDPKQTVGKKTINELREHELLSTLKGSKHDTIKDNGVGNMGAEL